MENTVVAEHCKGKDTVVYWELKGSDFKELPKNEDEYSNLILFRKGESYYTGWRMYSAYGRYPPKGFRYTVLMHDEKEFGEWGFNVFTGKSGNVMICDE